MQKKDLKTPTILLNIKALKNNIKKYQKLCTEYKKELWPMIKTHKSMEIVEMQIKEGATGVLCGTLDEAEACCQKGVKKIMYAYPVASEENIKKLKEEYPEVPDSLIELLKIVDGTYFREYKGKTVASYFLGSDVEEYPYYLLSSSQILETKNEAYDFYADYVDREYEEVEIDEEIISDSKKMKWLHFSDCMNNGGTSQLFIDFSPSEKGVKGQIVRFLHDPDEIGVIADSFDEYLEKLIESGLDFISEDIID